MVDHLKVLFVERSSTVQCSNGISIDEVHLANAVHSHCDSKARLYRRIVFVRMPPTLNRRIVCRISNGDRASRMSADGLALVFLWQTINKQVKAFCWMVDNSATPSDWAHGCELVMPISPASHRRIICFQCGNLKVFWRLRSINFSKQKESSKFGLLFWLPSPESWVKFDR